MGHQVWLSYGDDQKFPLKPDGNTVIGRGDVPFAKDPQVSREHLELSCSLRGSDASVVLRALGPNARRGTFIIRRESSASIGSDKEAVSEFPVSLFAGDMLDLFGGRYRFVLNIELPAPEVDGDEEFDGLQPGATLELSQFESEEFAANIADTTANRSAHRRAASSPGPLPRAKRTADAKDGQTLSTESPSPAKRRKLELKHGNSTIMMNPSELQVVRVVGGGACGEVLEATWRGTRVAVKKIFRTLVHADVLAELEHEVNTLRRLRHPNIVLFMGTCLDEDRGLLSVVTELCELGSLREVLDGSVGANPSLSLPWDTIIRMANDAARGLLYLHSLDPPILHRDVKSDNFLVDSAFKVKVTDFGLAKWNPEAHIAGSDQQSSNSNTFTFCGTIAWAAPEVLREVPYSLAADIYSFGVVLNEMATRVPPFSRRNSEGGLEATATREEIILGVSAGALRPLLPDKLPFSVENFGANPSPNVQEQLESFWREFADVVHVSWAQDPHQRPTMAILLNRLAALALPASVELTSANVIQRPTLRRGLTSLSMSNLSNSVVPDLAQPESERVFLDPDRLVLDVAIRDAQLSTSYSGRYVLDEGDSEGERIWANIYKDASELSASCSVNTNVVFQREDRAVRRLSSQTSLVAYFGSIESPRKAVVGLAPPSEFLPLSVLWTAGISSDTAVERDRRIICDTWFGVISLLDAIAKACAQVELCGIIQTLFRSDMLMVRYSSEEAGKPSFDIRISDSSALVCFEEFEADVVGSCTTAVALAAATQSHEFLAPEVFTASVEPNQGASITAYGFGVVMWTAVTRCLRGEYEPAFALETESAIASGAPSPGITPGIATIIGASHQNLRPRIYQTTPAVFSEVIRACWNPSASARPSLQRLVSALQEISDSFS